MGRFFEKRGHIKRPAWMRNKPFPRKRGPTALGNIVLIIILAIIAMILYH